MTVVSIEIIDGVAIGCGIEQGKDGKVEMRISPTCDGFVFVGGISARVKNGIAVFDIDLIDDGTIAPILIKNDCRIALPMLQKLGTRLDVRTPSAEFIYGLARDIDQMRHDILSLKKQIESLSESIKGTPLFKAPTRKDL